MPRQFAPIDFPCMRVLVRIFFCYLLPLFCKNPIYCYSLIFLLLPKHGIFQSARNCLFLKLSDLQVQKECVLVYNLRRYQRRNRQLAPPIAPAKATLRLTIPIPTINPLIPPPMNPPSALARICMASIRKNLSGFGLIVRLLTVDIFISSTSSHRLRAS